MRLRSTLVLAIFATIPAAPGCHWTPKPYANDPFVRQRRAVLGDPARPAALLPHVEPQPPAFPEGEAP